MWSPANILCSIGSDSKKSSLIVERPKSWETNKSQERGISGKTQQTSLWKKRSFVFYCYTHSLTQQDNFIGALPKSYRLEVHPRNTSNECPSRVIIGDCRLLHYGGLFLSRTQWSRHGVLCTGVRECQPQCRNRKHKLIQQRLMLSSDYHTHAVKTEKGRLQCTRSKMGRD